MPTRALATRLLLLAGAACLAGTKCDDSSGVGIPTVTFTDAEWAAIVPLANLPLVPKDSTNAKADNVPAAMLGKQYFFDTRFSGPLTHAANDGVSSGANGSVGETAKVSCARCHNPDTGFSDQRTVPDNTSLGAGFTGRNAPTLYNVDFNTWYFWDGRKDSLWSQALGPTESAVEHNGNRVQFAMVIRDLYTDGVVTPGGGDHDDVFGLLPAEIADLGTTYPFPAPPLPPQFPTQGRPGDSSDPGAGAFATYDGLPANVKLAVDRVFSQFGKAIHAYERFIVSKNSEFDKFVNGRPNTFSVAAQRGLKLFVGKGRCNVCHSGPNFTDNNFHNIGVRQAGTHVPVSPPADRGRIDGVPAVVADPFNGGSVFSDDMAAGNAKLAGATTGPVDLGKMKTPTLRSIAETGPYMHTGHIKTLKDVILFYSRGGDIVDFVGTNELTVLGLTPGEVDDLVEFMLALDGEELSPAITDPPILP